MFFFPLLRQGSHIFTMGISRMHQQRKIRCFFATRYILQDLQIIGMSSASFTRLIWPRYDSMSSNDFMLSMAKTHRNPSPVLIYWSLIAEYSSWPAVSSISSRHVSPSMTTCFLYESSIVGSYSSTKWFWISWIVSALFPTPPAVCVCGCTKCCVLIPAMVGINWNNHC